MFMRLYMVIAMQLVSTCMTINIIVAQQSSDVPPRRSKHMFPHSHIHCLQDITKPYQAAGGRNVRFLAGMERLESEQQRSLLVHPQE